MEHHSNKGMEERAVKPEEEVWQKAWGLSIIHTLWQEEIDKRHLKS